MSKNENCKVLESTRLDFRLFHQTVIDELTAHAYESPIMMKESDIYGIVDPTITMLLRHTYFVTCLNNTGIRGLSYYFTQDDFLEVFDDLRIKFSIFLEEQGILYTEHYLVMRVDNFDAVFLRLADDDYKEVCDKLDTIGECFPTLFD